MGNLVRNSIEIGFGIVFLIGAVFNIAYTFNHGDEFFGSFAEKALIKPAGQFVESVVIPNARVFTVLMILLQLTVAVCILSRGSLVKPGLLLGAVFALGAAFFSNGPGAVANLILAAVQAFLALTR